MWKNATVIKFIFLWISAIQSPLSVLLGMKSMPKIVGGKIIAGDSTNVQVTVLKKLPDLEKKTELPTDYPNYDEKIPHPSDYVPYDDDYPEFDKIPDYGLQYTFW